MPSALDNVSDSTILIVVGIAAIVLIYYISKNALLLNALSSVNPSDVVEAVRGLSIMQLVIYSISLVAVVGGGFVYLSQRGGADKIIHAAKQAVTDISRELTPNGTPAYHGPLVSMNGPGVTAVNYEVSTKVE